MSDPVQFYLSCAVSADGFLDDVTAKRAILSSKDDLNAVLALRATMDMIVVGAETLRRDNPSLATRGSDHFAVRAAAGRSAHPVKLIISRSGQIPTDRAVFESGDAETIILSQSPTEAPGTIEPLRGHPIPAIRTLAEKRGLSRVLIEGGAQILHLGLPHAETLRLAVSPRTLGDRGHAFFMDPSGIDTKFFVAHRERLGSTQVYHIDLIRTRALPLMQQAFELSKQCPPSQTAFAVGCIGCQADLTPLARGYSRETGPSDHAEEAMLSKLADPPHTVICTLEPCLTRASKPLGCAQRLVAAGVKRVIYAIAEDETFTAQTGLSYLRNKGVDVLALPGFEDDFRRINAPIYG